MCRLRQGECLADYHYRMVRRWSIVSVILALIAAVLAFSVILEKL